MVEFPFVGPVERKGFCDAGYEIYLRWRDLLTLNFVSSSRHPTRLICGKLAHSPQAAMRG
jgi:hypothetical protein